MGRNEAGRFVLLSLASDWASIGFELDFVRLLSKEPSTVLEEVKCTSIINTRETCATKFSEDL